MEAVDRDEYIGLMEPLLVSDASRPSVKVSPLGTFGKDWEYVANTGDLDECYGRTGVTPEFPKGIYHYFAADNYPYFQRCVKGAVKVSKKLKLCPCYVGTA